jgi:hypothetical protein
MPITCFQNRVRGSPLWENISLISPCDGQVQPLRPAEGGSPKGFVGAARTAAGFTKDVPGGLGQFASQRFARDDIAGLGQLSVVPALGAFIVTANSGLPLQ